VKSTVEVLQATKIIINIKDKLRMEWLMELVNLCAKKKEYTKDSLLKVFRKDLGMQLISCLIIMKGKLIWTLRHTQS
jgi:hypothetical protein